MNILQTEPAVSVGSIGAIVTALLVLLISFGVPITPDQRAAISALAALVIPIVAAIVIRSQVTPVAMLPAAPVIPPVIPPVIESPPHG